MTKLEQLEARAKALATELSAVREAVHEERCRLAGVKEGDIVWSPELGAVVMVTDVTCWAGNKAWVKGSPRKKDGAWSKTERHLGSHWEPITPHPSKGGEKAPLEGHSSGPLSGSH